MNLLRAYTRCATLLTALGITCFAAAVSSQSEQTPLLAILGLPAALLAWWLSVRGRFLLPRWIVNILLGVALLYALVRVTQEFSVDAIGELVIFIQIIKIGDRRSPRDDAQILSLAVFLTIAAMLTSNAFWVGVQLLLFYPLLIATVMLFQIYSGWFNAASSPPGLAAPPPSVRVPRQLRTVAAFATVGGAAVAFFVFIIMPRGIGENALGDWRRRQVGSVTGFTDHVKLGSRSVISTSQRIVMEVLFRDIAPDGTVSNLGSPEAVFYMRGAVLDQYRNGAWVVDPTVEGGAGSRIQSINRADSDIPLGSGPSGAIVQQVVTVRSMASNMAPLFSLWRPVRIHPGRDTATLHIDHWAKTFRRSGRGGQHTYTVWSALIDSNREPERRTPTSFDSPVVREFASNLLRQAGIDPDPTTRPISDDARATRLFEAFLRENYTYTLEEQAVPEGRDPIEFFLQESRQGHCEYFAAAMVALCRSVGIHARMVAGYVAAEFDQGTGRYVIRDANAHAWVEAEAGEGRWRRYDPTPPSDLARIHKPAPSLFGRLRRVLESAEYAWNASIVGFDEGARRRLLGPDSGDNPTFLSRLDRLAARVRMAGPRHLLNAVAMGLAVFLAVASVGILLQAAAAYLPRFRMRRRSVAAPGHGFDPAQVRFYAALLDLLNRRGHPKPAWRPPLEHAARIAPADAALAEGASRLAALYYRARFGARPLTDAEQAAARELLASLSRPSSPR